MSRLMRGDPWPVNVADDDNNVAPSIRPHVLQLRNGDMRANFEYMPTDIKLLLKTVTDEALKTLYCEPTATPDFKKACLDILHQRGKDI